ncbi:MAG: GtrA family protein [Polaromonas sp.]|uniref:GtrA family protein n=1 Tax=Polaromonas sp. TaxID=1869339 RepID=UPI0017B7C052|nr:GtrA family protein [Polaromonas sp.]NMM09633.1 GtrA family protein [Polaromonas sp.]
MSALRSFAERLISHLPRRLQVMVRWRFIKFGVVGASGTVINIAVLYVAQEFLLTGIEDFHSRLNYSIALAITLATISNFYWNRRLTWRDRKHQAHHSALLLFFNYVMAAGLSIVIQSLLTKWLAVYMHYLVANLVAIVIASAANFVANDRMTFRRRRAKIETPGSTSDSASPPADVHDKP